jgi:hypothetical protein
VALEDLGFSGITALVLIISASGVNVKLSSSFQWYFKINSLEDKIVHRHALFLPPRAWHAYH